MVEHLDLLVISLVGPFSSSNVKSLMMKWNYMEGEGEGRGGWGVEVTPVFSFIHVFIYFIHTNASCIYNVTKMCNIFNYKQEEQLEMSNKA